MSAAHAANFARGLQEWLHAFPLLMPAILLTIDGHHPEQLLGSSTGAAVLAVTSLGQKTQNRGGHLLRV